MQILKNSPLDYYLRILSILAKFQGDQRLIVIICLNSSFSSLKLMMRKSSVKLVRPDEAEFSSLFSQNVGQKLS